MADKYRLVTRSDFDGLVCGALLNSLNMIDEVKFVKIKNAAGKAFLPTLANVVAGDYSLARPLHMVTLGQPTGHLKTYMDWIMSGIGQGIVSSSGYVPVQ